MSETRYCVVKYDNLSLERDPERPGRSRSYSERDVAAPQAFDTTYDTVDECREQLEKLNNTSRGEDIDIVLANGSRYSGPRYTFVMGEVTI